MNRKKIFFLHIPKTAGSSMKKFLAKLEKNKVPRFSSVKVHYHRTTQGE